MADEQPQPGADQPPVGINILAQYVKDLSFENPRAPESLTNQAGQPAIDVGISVGVNEKKDIGDDIYEVVLNLSAKATTNDGNDAAFLVEMAYGGLFRLINVPQEHLNLFLIIEAPRLIFPYARRVFADAVRDGGFPPLMLDPVDFAKLYMQQQQQQGGGQNGPGGQSGEGSGGDTPNIILPS